jgi:hypothetical protein
MQSLMRVTKKMTGDGLGIGYGASGRLSYARDKRLSIDTMDAAQEEMNMLGFIFQRTKTMDKQKV